MARILVVDDQESIRKAIALRLKKLGHEVREAANGEVALATLTREGCDLLLTDLRMPGIDGLELLSKVRELFPSLAVIVLTAFATIESAVEAMKSGADDYLSKPLNLDELVLRVDSVLAHRHLLEENARLRRELQERFGFDELVGGSPQIAELKERLAVIARDPDLPVLLTGESGTGKELVARAIHFNSPRSIHPFVAINCAALPDDLLESELFGYEKGAFTGATAAKKGLIEAADHGTLFLDEVSSMSAAMQAKLLRVLQERVFRKLGASAEVKAGARIIGATNRNLAKLIESGTFREDLYYRLAVVPVYIPPLRAREGDVQLLAGHFLRKIAREKSKSLHFTPQALLALSSYAWPGNIRELENLVAMVVATRDDGPIDPNDLPDRFRSDGVAMVPADLHNLREAARLVIRNFECEFIRRRLEANRWNITKTAGQIGLSRTALHEKIKEYKLSE